MPDELPVFWHHPHLPGGKLSLRFSMKASPRLFVRLSTPKTMIEPAPFGSTFFRKVMSLDDPAMRGDAPT